MLDGPEDEIGDGRLDPEEFELGGDLASVVGGVVDDVAEGGPERSGGRLASEILVGEGCGQLLGG